nr:hypothetical protein [Tanacetum cinerariifolium]
MGIYGFVAIKSANYSKSRQSREKYASMLLERARKNKSNGALGSYWASPIFLSKVVTPPKMCVASEYCTGALLHNTTALVVWNLGGQGDLVAKLGICGGDLDQLGDDMEGLGSDLY